MTDKADLVDETGKNSIDPKHAPVALPAASFEIEELHKGLNAAARAKLEDRAQKIQEAFEAAVADKAFLGDRNQTPAGYRVVEVKHEELSKLAGYDVMERTIAYDPKLAEQAEAEQAKSENTTSATKPVVASQE